MRVVKRVVLFPIIMLLKVAILVMKLLIRLGCLVAGVGFLLLASCVLLAVLNCQWHQMGILIGMILAGVVILLFSTDIQLALEDIMTLLCK